MRNSKEMNEERGKNRPGNEKGRRGNDMGEIKEKE